MTLALPARAGPPLSTLLAADLRHADVSPILFDVQQTLMKLVLALAASANGKTGGRPVSKAL